MNVKKLGWLMVGGISLGLGAVGAVLPLLPTVPFLLLAAYSFARSSEKLHEWFVHTNLYKKNLESYVKGQGMTQAAKRRIMITVTLLMGFGFFMMFRKGLYLPCGILAGVWLFHVIYFVFVVKTCRTEIQTSKK